MIERGQLGRVRKVADRQSPAATTPPDPLPPVPSEFDQGDLIARYRAAEARVEIGAAPDPLEGLGFWRMVLWACLLIPLAEIWQALRERFRP